MPAVSRGRFRPICLTRIAAFSLLLVLAVFLSFPGPGCASTGKGTEAWWLDGSWPQEHTTLKPHPDAVFGRLENGLRYVLLRHAAPRDRAALYLNMQIGSFMETDEQAGIAHYMEHMMFNGTRHFPPGELIRYFQSVGMGFGADANAHTSTQETVYKLQVPTRDSDVLRQGLVVLADFLDGATIAEQEVENERGVILEEKTARDTERFEAVKRRLRFALPDTRFVKPTIGSEAVIRGADARLLRGFYDAWYRPELAVVVAVGDFDVQALEAQVRDVFASVGSRAERPAVPAWGDVSRKGVHAYYDRRPGTTGMVMVEALHPRRHDRDSPDVQRTMITEQIAVHMLQNRLMTLVNREGAPCLKGVNTISRTFGEIPNARIMVIPRDGRWKESVRVVENELRRALRHGFTDIELERARKFFRNYFKQGVKRETARSSSDIAREIIACLNQDRVYQSPQQTLDMFLSMMRAISLEDVHRAFCAAWNSGNRIVSLSGMDVDGNPEKALLNAWSAAAKVVVKPWEADPDVRFPYLDVPRVAGKVAKRSAETGLPAPYSYQRVDYANGVSLFMKPTSVEKDKVMLSLWFGRGIAFMDDRQQALARFAFQVLRHGGVGKLSLHEQSQVLSGRKLNIDWTPGFSGFGLTVSCLRSDQELAMHLLRTAVLNPVVRENQYRSALTFLKSDSVRNAGTVAGVFASEGARFLASGAGHHAALEYDQAKNFSLKDVRLFLAEAFRRGPVSLCAVGDFRPEEMEKMSGRFFGTLPEWKQAVGESACLGFPEGRSEVVHTNRDLPQAGVLLAVPVPYVVSDNDGQEADIVQIRLGLLRGVLFDRLRVSLRENLGATYSPRARMIYTSLFPEHGYLCVQVATEAGKTELVDGEVRRILTDLAENGVSAKELERAVKQSLSIREKVLDRLGFWNSQLITQACVHEDGFARAAHAADVVRETRVEDVNALARKYLDLDKAATLTVLPPAFGNE